jgi:hypothetical protein
MTINSLDLGNTCNMFFTKFTTLSLDESPLSFDWFRILTKSQRCGWLIYMNPFVRYEHVYLYLQKDMKSIENFRVSRLC